MRPMHRTAGGEVTLLESEVVLLAEEVVPKNVASAMMLEFKNTLDLGVWDEEIYLDEKLPPGCVPLMLITTESLDGLGELVKVRCRLVARGGQAKFGGLDDYHISRCQFRGRAGGGRSLHG